MMTFITARLAWSPPVCPSQICPFPAGGYSAGPRLVEKIRSCEDFRALFEDYRAGRLSEARRLLVEDHIHECVACRHVMEGRPKVTEFPAAKTAAAPQYRWAVAAMVDYRTGFPYSVVNEHGYVQGAVDAQRYPSNFDLNPHLERRFVFRGYRLAARVGMNNVTGHRNPTAVNNIVGSPSFGTFYGIEGRHFVVRLRFLGRLGK